MEVRTTGVPVIGARELRRAADIQSMSNAIPNNLERPLYNEAVYGIKNMNMIQEEMIFMDLLLYLLSKNSGIVLESSFCVISLVLLPSRKSRMQL